MNKTCIKIGNSIIDLENVDIVNLQEDEKTVSLYFQFKDCAHSLTVNYDAIEFAKKDFDFIWETLCKA